MTTVRNAVRDVARNTGRDAGAGVGEAKDAFFANVVLLLHLDGADAQTTTVDSSNSAHAIVLSNAAELDTANALFGPTALLCPASIDFASAASNPDFQYGTGDFTIEISADGGTWAAGVHIIYEQRLFNAEVAPVIYHDGLNLVYFTSNAVRISAAGVLANNTYAKIAVSRVAGVTRMFLNGVQVGANFADNNDYIQRHVVLGQTGEDLASNTFGFSGHIDEVRVTKGVGRYAANYIAPTAPFPNS